MAIMSCMRINPSREMSVDEFKGWIRQFDMDHDGRISREELKDALNSMKVWFGWWKARRGMKEADLDHNGTIDANSELEKLVYYAEQHLNMKIYRYVW